MLTSGNTSRRPEFKEKFVEITQDIFKNHLLSNESTSPNLFWDNYLILPVNVQCLTKLFQENSEENLLDLRQNLGSLFTACLEKLELTEEEVLSLSEKTRQQHAFTILSVVFRNLFSKKRLTHFNIISILTGLDQADSLFKRLIKAIQKHIQEPSTRSPALQLSLVVSAGSDNVNQNGLNGYFMANDISVTLFNILGEDEVTENDQRDIVMLLGMLSNYNKYESKNPYLACLRKIKQPEPIENIINMYTSTFVSLRSRYLEIYDDEETFSKTFVTYMSRWFSSTAPSTPTEAESSQILAALPSAQTALLLTLFDLINNNLYFLNAIVNSCTKLDNEFKDDVQNKTTFLTSILSFASYLFENNRSERTNIYSRLLLTIILRLVEENTIMNYIAREGSSASIRLCRQRSPTLPLIKTSRHLFCAILDDMLLYVRHNVRKKLDLISYRLAFSVIHRVLCFISKHKLRLNYHWVELWPTLTSVLHFTVQKLDDFKLRGEFSLYLSTFINIFNICVTHGEVFLSDTKSYDSLYYEIIRASADFTTLSDFVHHSMGQRGGDKSPLLTINEFNNIKLICNHFKPALDEWQSMKNIKFPTPEQVMSIINENYTTLELKPMDKLDSYVAFNEIPNEMGFFRQVLRVAVTDYLDYYTL